ncbi:hypothetical protein BDZ91DRAFT_264218 [Kalaharituber pfeilii]|nr:hypothetical protein BDZ91DRAFT_264218 [Kalaharituber pfeilii]
MASSDPPFKVRALFDYVSTHEDDLNFVSGEAITVISIEDADWYYGEYTDKETGEHKEGIFPMNFVEKIVAEPPPRPKRSKKKASEHEGPEPAAPVRAPSPPPTQVVQATSPVMTAAAAPVSKPEEPSTPVAKVESRIASPPSAPKNMPTSPEPPKPKSPPPPAPEKTSGVASSFRDRIAAFNKQAEAPVKPAPWGAPGPKPSFVKKPYVPPPPSKNAYIPPVVSHVQKPRRDEETSMKEREPTEVLAAQEEEREPPVKISSLKDRIAALQSIQLDPTGKPKPKPPKPKPKIENEASGSVISPAAEQIHAASTVAEEGDGLEDIGKEPVAIRNIELEDAIKAKDIVDPEQSAVSAKAKKSVELRRAAVGLSDEGAESAGDADVSSSGGHDEVIHPKPPGSSGKITSRRAEEKDDDGDDEGADDGSPESADDEEQEKEEIDPEVARRLAIRERMMKMSGGMGMHGMMFGPPPGMGGLPKRKPSESKPSGENAKGEEESRVQPVPIFPMGFGLPGMRPPVPAAAPAPAPAEEPQVREDTESDGDKTASAAVTKKISEEHAPSDVVDIEDIKEHPNSDPQVHVPPRSPQISPEARPTERAPPPPPLIPQEHPTPPHPPVSDRPPPPPPPNQDNMLSPPSQPIMPSASEGSESDDEASEVNTGTLSVSPSSIGEGRPPPPPAPASLTSPTSPTSPKRQSYYASTQMPPPPAQAPTSPTTSGNSGKRTSYIRGSNAPPVPSTFSTTQMQSPPVPAITRPPPPPPPQPPSLPPQPPAGLPSRHSVELSRGAAKSDTEGEVTEYEADYDTDLANKVAHKDALKAHHHHHSTRSTDEGEDDDTPLPSPTLTSSPQMPRAAPPAPPSAPLKSKRQSLDMPRGVPPPPPTVPPREIPQYEEEAEEEEEQEEEEEEQPVHAPRQHAPPPPPPGPPPPFHQVPLAPSRHAPLPPPPPPTGPPPLPTHALPSMHPPPPPAPPSDYTPETLPRRSFGSGTRPSMDVGRQTSTSSGAPRRSMEQNRPLTSDCVAHDVDLNEHSQWWKYPARVPPVFENRPRDLIFEIEESTTTSRNGRVTITREIFVLFHDYSQTIVTVQFDRDDPSNAELEQKHEPPPSHLRQDQLEDYHGKYGANIYDGAVTRQNTVVGDGDAYTFLRELFALVPNALKPVGNRYGALVYANLANASVQQYDEIRPGDIITFRNAKFQGHKGGLHQKYSMEVGKPEHVGVVLDWDGTKKKLRAFEQGREKGKVKVESFKVGDLRSGEVKVWRVVGREWVGWQRT